MKLKAILALTLFFVGTPFILGQNRLPTLPVAPSVPSLPGQPSLPNVPSTPTLPAFSTPAVPRTLPLESLSGAGIPTSAISNPSQAARGMVPNQGIFNNAFSNPLPNRDNAANLAKELAKRTFPEEFKAAQGGISTPTIPSVPSIPSTPTIPSAPTIPTIPSTPTIPSVPTLPAIPQTPTFNTPSI